MTNKSHKLYKKIVRTIMIAVVMTAAVPNIASASSVNSSQLSKIESPHQIYSYFADGDPALDCASNRDKCDLMKKYVNPIINFLTAFVGVAVTIGIISGGIRYASAADDPQKIGAAKKQIASAILALLTLMVLYVALRWLMPSLL